VSRGFAFKETGMKCSSATLAILALISGVLRAQEAPRPVPANEEREVRAVQDQLITAYIQRDVAALERILAPEYTFVESHGRSLSRADLIDGFRSGDRVLVSYTIDDDHVRVYGATAVMTYHYRSSERYRGEDQSGEFRFLRVFVKREGRWQMVAGQETASPTTR
jgi:ketosteroid isomerase-like protein